MNVIFKPIARQTKREMARPEKEERLKLFKSKPR